MITGSPIGSHIQSMTEENRQRLKQMVKARLPIDDHGAIVLRHESMR